MTLSKMMRWSVRLDIQLLTIPELPIAGKIRFILSKYLHYVRDRLFGFGGRSRSVVVFGRSFYYNDLLGLASLQRVYCASYRLKSLLPDNPVVIDIGANIGQFSFFCHQYLKAAKVISIEPLKECYELLKRNSASQGCCFNCAVGNENREIMFYLSKESSQLSSYVPDDNISYAANYFVQCRKLDEVINGNGIDYIDLLKIDTEGSELEILQSAVQILGKTEVVLVEMSVFRKSTGDFFETGTFLKDKGFSLVELTAGRESRPKDMDGVFKRL